MTLRLPKTRDVEEAALHHLKGTGGDSWSDPLKSALGSIFGLTAEEQRAPMPNQPEAHWPNRIRTALKHLRERGLLEPSRTTGYYRLTARGLGVSTASADQISRREREVVRTADPATDTIRQSSKITKILIANRGEIACRIMRTAKRMGIATVAVYSDADARASHVLLADESVRLGPAPAAESYLNPELILLAARETGADAIHPGYGFLSERESFARACAEAGVAFIGPPPNAIAAMGDKIESKKLAKAAGVNVVPGFLGEIADTDDAVRIAGDIGYPVMMKASAGGGGKGMRLAWSEQDVREGFEATKREGLASFGDDRVFIEKFIESPRHIEIQVLGDQHGTVLYLGERECSIQRRHQKVVEEAPSPFVTPKMRKAMGEQAVALAQAVGYYSAGTVELIVSGADTTGESFYFLEMNTRLQVEHPVTEAVTGLDLVEQMIRIAAGEKLAFAQDDVRLDGWAVENRVYAEDPYRGFLPSTGRLVRYAPPAAEAHQEPLLPSPEGEGLAYVRVDDGVREGGEVSIFYDPMIAKLITWAPTREAAIDAQVAALDRFVIEGVGNNIDFLSALMQHPRFRAGAITTGFIAEEYPDGFHGAPASDDLLRTLAAVAAFAATAEADRARRVDGQLGPKRGGRLPPPDAWVVRIGAHEHQVLLATDTIVVDGDELDLAMEYTPGDTLVEVEVGATTILSRRRPGPSSGERDHEELPSTTGTIATEPGLAPGKEEGTLGSLSVKLQRTRTGFRLTTRGASHVARVLPAHAAAYAHHLIEKVPPDLSRFLLAPMPGLLVRLDVGAGDKVEAGQPLAVVEAMKMENILRAGKSGVVKSVEAGAGDSLAVDQVILELE